MSDDHRFAILPDAARTWAVGAVHGEAERLCALHDALSDRIAVGDNLIYLGNLLGRGGAVIETIDEALRFRRACLARASADVRSVAFLRGGQEEMWHKLLQLQLANDPGAVLKWMLDQGVDATLEGYGGHVRAGTDAARQGASALSHWTTELRDRIRHHDGHNAFMGALRRAAFPEKRNILYVSAGLDPRRPMTEQRDSFWWGAADFDRIEAPYGEFSRIVRGLDPRHGGFQDTETTVTVDGGCGYEGALVAACLDTEGRVVDRIEV